MVNLPANPQLEAFNADLVLLQLNTDTYTIVHDLDWHLERPVTERVLAGITSSGNIPILRRRIYGAADNYLSGTIVLTKNEYITLVNDFLRDSHGVLPPLTMSIKLTNMNGVTLTVGNVFNSPTGFTVKVRMLHASKPDLGLVTVRIRLDILEDSITAS